MQITSDNLAQRKKASMSTAIVSEAGTRCTAALPLTIANLRGSTMAAPTQARALEYFNYDPETGHLIFRERPRGEFGSASSYGNHKKLIGKPAGSMMEAGYIRVHIDGKYFPAHRIIWLIMTGIAPQYPANEIDHINGVPNDNRWKNLRLVTKSENQRNGSQRVNNSSGVHGVNWKPTPSGGGGWVARIWNGPRHVYLGFFGDIREAQIARKAAERALGYSGTDRPPSPRAIKRAERKKAEQYGWERPKA